MISKSTNPFDFQDRLIELLGIPKELCDQLVEINIKSNCREFPTATLSLEVHVNGEIATDTKKYTICEVEGEPA